MYTFTFYLRKFNLFVFYLCKQPMDRSIQESRESGNGREWEEPVLGSLGGGVGRWGVKSAQRCEVGIELPPWEVGNTGGPWWRLLRAEVTPSPKEGVEAMRTGLTDLHYWWSSWPRASTWATSRCAAWELPIPRSNPANNWAQKGY